MNQGTGVVPWMFGTKWFFLGAIITVLLALKSVEEARRLLFTTGVQPAITPEANDVLVPSRISLWTQLVTPPVPVPPPSTPSNRLTIVFCKSCHANGLYQQIQHYVEQHVRWVADSERKDEKSAKQLKVLTDPQDSSQYEVDQDDDEPAMIPLEINPVSGSPAPLFKLLGLLVGVVQFLIVTTCVSGLDRVATFGSSLLPVALKRRIFGTHDEPLVPAEWVVSWNQYRWQILGGTFFLGNILRTMLMTTTAFELFLGEKLIYSGLKEGHIPTLENVIRGLDAAGATILSQ